MTTRKVTYIVAPICDRFICRFVYTLYKYSEPNSFNLIVIDQTKDGFSKEIMDYLHDKMHLYMHPTKREFGYAKAMNEGIIHGLHWGTPYICCANDDIEIMDKRWIQGIYDTFAMDEERIMAVVPMSPRVAGWGYGVVENPEVLPYKEEYTPEDYDFLIKGDFSQVPDLPKTHPKQMGGTVVDGAAFIMPYFKREAFQRVGLFDEHFFPGSGEDYDWLARAYSIDLRVVSTSLSWVWHHWSKSKDLYASGELEDPYFKPADRPYWNNQGDLWPASLNEGHEHDVWGHYVDKDGRKVPLKRVAEVFVDDI